LAVERAYSTYFEDRERFPAGSVCFDCGLVMRNIPHEWETAEDMYVGGPLRPVAPGASSSGMVCPEPE